VYATVQTVPLSPEPSHVSGQMTQHSAPKVTARQSPSETFDEAPKQARELLICQLYVDSPHSIAAQKTFMLPGCSRLPLSSLHIVSTASRRSIGSSLVPSRHIPPCWRRPATPRAKLSTSSSRAAYQAPPPRKSQPVKMTTEPPTTLKGQPFDKVVLDGMLRRRMFYTPSFEVGQCPYPLSKLLR
jgi:hypothetical protein